ncbi:hypothetical protein FGSG_12654 [Fusarium graminearum PH-1]|uniref:hypothetical protein n=1 Tax=Gibberella zeae (strain ATCC MYA-4620 / CBS 123657 / FGSC 9075 / NRRL 31084 / PH-1) TaxID=229533 RepID=UPI00021F1EC8|nr:hypothetical protein FGSG_12654 [Fusarium graminearum PH-1]ESU10855.1 hypothetical protein FGSG_12654 [Fusarium graminearum PH-1]|eukprot:XP_011323431.1 hypothetical protein FGSG_12654 [Fusarium graminearum PH-1]
MCLLVCATYTCTACGHHIKTDTRVQVCPGAIANDYRNCTFEFGYKLKSNEYLQKRQFLSFLIMFSATSYYKPHIQHTKSIIQFKNSRQRTPCAGKQLSPPGVVIATIS